MKSGELRAESEEWRVKSEVLDLMRCIVRTPAREMCRGKGGAAEVPLLFFISEG